MHGEGSGISTLCPDDGEVKRTQESTGGAKANIERRYSVMFDHNDLLTPEELAVRLKVQPTWVYEKTRARSRDRLPAIKLGRYLRFCWPEIVTWLDNHRQP